MRLSVQRLRWLLLGGAVLLVAVLAGYIAHGRYMAYKRLRAILDQTGGHFSQDTDNFTYSQTVQGRTIFTLRAAKAIPAGKGVYKLHKATLTLYGRTEGSADTIYGDDFEYDEKDGVARALGVVHMDLQAPHAIASTGRAIPSTPPPAPRPGEPEEERAGIIHIQTSGLRYIRKLGIAATDEQVEMRYGDMQCTSKGAEFSSDQSILRLLADVRITGQLRGAPVTMTASTAEMDRVLNVATFVSPVAQSQGRTVRAERVTANLRKEGSIETIAATGGVVMNSGTQQIKAARLDASLGESSLPQTAKLTGGVTLVDTSALRPTQGSAQAVNATFDTHGALSKAVAAGGAKFSSIDKRNGAPLKREMSGQSLTALFTSTGKKNATQLSELHVEGAAKASGDSLTAAAKGKPAQAKVTQLAADDLHAIFALNAEGKAELQRINGAGHTLLQQDGSGGAQQASTGDALEIALAHTAGSRAETIASATQTGHVVIHTRSATKNDAKKSPTTSTANADRAAYDGVTERLRLTGAASFNDGSTQMNAASLTLDQRTSDALAEGNVTATLQNTPTTGAKPAQPTHVIASSAHLQHDTQTAEFHGTDGQPARLWQGASQVEAANLFFDGAHKTLIARPAASTALIHAVFAATPDATKPARKSGMSLVRVASQRMDYSDTRREAVFAGAVDIDGMLGNVQSQRAVVLLQPVAAKNTTATPTPFGSSIDKVVLSGAVHMESPGRRGNGEQLLYTAATDSYTLTGTPEAPPQIVDAKQGTVTGATLVFADQGSNIVVAGEAANGKATHGRVRTETEVKH